MKIDYEKTKEMLHSLSPDTVFGKAKRKGWICPICGNGSGTDGDGLSTKDNIHYTCFKGCFSGSDVIDIFGRDYESFQEKIEATCKELNVTPIEYTGEAKPRKEQPMGIEIKKEKKEEVQTDLTLYLTECASKIKNADEYLSSRGISVETAKRFGVGYDPNYSRQGARNWKALILPTSKYSYNARNIDVDADGKNGNNKWRKQGKSLPFNILALKKNEPIVICEGEIDALSVEEVGFRAIGLSSASGKDNFVKAIEEKHPLKPLVLWADNDDAGKSAVSEISEALEQMNIKYVTVSSEYKDANAHLVADRDGMIQLLKDAMEDVENLVMYEVNEYRKSAVGNDIFSFYERVKERKKEPLIKTGYKSLDEYLCGGLFPGLYVLGGTPGSGKTAYCLQMAEQISKQGKDVLWFALEMSKEELMARSISRHSYETSIEMYGELGSEGQTQKYPYCSKSHTQILRGMFEGEDDIKLINNALNRYGEYAENLFIIENDDEHIITLEYMVKTINKHIEITGNVPVVICDYLQIIPNPEGKDIRIATGDAIRMMSTMAKKHNTPIIMISSQARSTYSKETELDSFKESGSIEYSADMAMGITTADDGAKLLKVVKCRYGDPNKKFRYLFDGMYMRFKEIN